jgi:hypothetical protein
MKNTIYEKLKKKPYIKDLMKQIDLNIVKSIILNGNLDCLDIGLK